MSLFAHHVELQHYPVLALFFCVGIGVGWQVMSLLLNRNKRVSEE